MKRSALAIALALAVGGAQAADPEAGAILASQCAGCHGADGVSVDDKIPNLAAQKAGYIAGQLTAFRKGDRKNALMNAIAAQLSDDDIENLAAHFASLPGAAPGADGTPSDVLSGALPVFPADYKDGFTKYHTISFADRGQVRHYWANQAALEGARAGGELPSGAFILVEVFKAKTGADGAPVKGDDGHFVAGDLSVYTAMQKEAGWGETVPALLRNGDWRYAVFATDGTNRTGLNEGQCLACHKPETAIDYVFTLEQLTAAGGG